MNVWTTAMHSIFAAWQLLQNLKFVFDIVVRIIVEVTCGITFIEKWRLPIVLAKVAIAIFRGE